MQEEINKFLEKENKELLWKLCRDLGAFSDTPKGNDDFSKLLDEYYQEVKSKTWKLNEFNNTFIHQTLRRNMGHLFSDL